MKIRKYSQNSDEVSADVLSSYVETLSLFRGEYGSTVTKDISKMIDNLPPRSFINSSMDSVERQLLFQTVGHIWKTLTGASIKETMGGRVNFSRDKNLDGNYWMMPGGILVGGFNHFAAAKNHRNLLCSILGINQFVFEAKALEKSPEELIRLVLTHGGIRVKIDRGNNQVFMQTSERSWPWAREKARRMYHKKKMVKVLDARQPYKGWKSGVPVLVK